MRQLRVAAKALIRFLRYLTDLVPKSFQRLRVNNATRWLDWANELGLTATTELDCKQQFNKIQPRWIESHVEEGVQYLSKKQRWRMTDIMWRVHHNCAAMDRVSKGCSSFGTCGTMS